MTQQSNQDRRQTPSGQTVRKTGTPTRSTASSTGQSRQRSASQSKKKRQKLRFHNKNLKYQLLTVAAVVLAVVLCLVVFFRVNRINIHNNGAGRIDMQAEQTAEAPEEEIHTYYSAEEIEKASGIEKGDNLLTISKESVAAKIMAELPYVSEVHIQRVLPGMVDITVSEFDVAYAIQDSFDGWWLINRDGRILEQTTETEANTHLTVVGLRVNAPTPANALEPEQLEDMAEQEAKVSSLISILQLIEDYDYCKNIVKIDLTASYDIRLWYGNQYEIRIGNTENLDYKLRFLAGTLKELKSYQAGTIDMTFTEDNSVRFQPFEE